MKDLLKFVATYQEEYIATIRQKKDASQLSEVAGVNLGGTIPAAQYKDILENLDGFVKEHRRFSEDSTKIILEKNSAIRALEGMNLFFFRNLRQDSYGGQNWTHISAPKDFTSWTGVYYSGFVFPGVIYALMPAFIICLITAASNSIIGFAVAAIIALMILSFRIKLHLGFKRWIPQVALTPGRLLRGIICDSTDQSLLDIRVAIDLGNNPSKSWYERVLKETLVLASKVEGRIGWVWNWGLMSKDEYKFSVVHRASLYHAPIENGAEISIKNNDDNLLCFIETKHSLIFHFPPNDMGYEGLKGVVTHDEKVFIVKKFEESKEKMFSTFIQK